MKKIIPFSKRNAKEWREIYRPLIRKYIHEAGKGSAAHMAKVLGTHNSQIHRYSCPVCEHDQMPTQKYYNAVIQFLKDWEAVPYCVIARNYGKGANYRGHRKGCPKEWRVPTPPLPKNIIPFPKLEQFFQINYKEGRAYEAYL